MIEAKASVQINASAEDVWNFLIRFDDWWVRSNPEDHIELSLVENNEIKEGSRLVLKEVIAGIKGEALVEIAQMTYPRKLVWKSIDAKFKLMGMNIIADEGGVFELEEHNGGCILSHHVWGSIRTPLIANIIEWIFKNVLKGEKKDYAHTNKELLFIKREIEASNA